mmetsp:Transcript_16740/g.20125  ORF Transcript_16740/g.20125 Transcript_16740/m.20125 type:complete len:235 (+) Transcript_16740:1-705(+)
MCRRCCGGKGCELYRRNCQRRLYAMMELPMLATVVDEKGKYVRRMEQSWPWTWDAAQHQLWQLAQILYSLQSHDAPMTCQALSSYGYRIYTCALRLARVRKAMCEAVFKHLQRAGPLGHVALTGLKLMAEHMNGLGALLLQHLRTNRAIVQGYSDYSSELLASGRSTSTSTSTSASTSNTFGGFSCTEEFYRRSSAGEVKVMKVEMLVEYMIQQTHRLLVRLRRVPDYEDAMLE